MKVHIITNKFLPPWDSAIASLSLNLVLGLIHRGFKVLVHTTNSNVAGYVKMYGYKSTYHILEDLKILREIRSTEVIYENAIKGLIRGLYDEPILIVEPHSIALTMCGLNRKCSVIFIAPRRYYHLRYYATFYSPWSSKHMPVGVPITLYESLGDDKDVRLLIDSIRERVDYVAGFMGPIMDSRVSLFDITRIIKLLEQRYKIRLGVVGFITIRHIEDEDFTWKSVQKINKLFGSRVMLRISAVSMRTKATLCRYTDFFLYPIIHPVELADPPFSVLEWAVCGKPSVFLSFGVLSRLYPFRECMYDTYSVTNVASAIHKCLRVIENDVNRYVLRKFIYELFSLDRLADKLEEIIKYG